MCFHIIENVHKHKNIEVKKKMGWRGRGGGWAGPWPGRGPFSYLPPWQRPGWMFSFGRGFGRWWGVTRIILGFALGFRGFQDGGGLIRNMDMDYHTQLIHIGEGD